MPDILEKEKEVTNMSGEIKPQKKKKKKIPPSKTHSTSLIPGIWYNTGNEGF